MLCITQYNGGQDGCKQLIINVMQSILQLSPKIFNIAIFLAAPPHSEKLMHLLNVSLFILFLHVKTSESVEDSYSACNDNDFLVMG